MSCCRRVEGAEETHYFPLARRLRWLRILQYLIALANLVTTAYLAALLSSEDVSVGGAVPVPIIDAGLAFLITCLGQWLGVHLSGYRNRAWLGTFIFFDIICLGLQIPSVVVLAVAGLPRSCHGVARGSDGSIFDPSGQTLLPKYCAIPKSVFWLSIISMFLYVYSLGIIVRQIMAVSRHVRALEAGQGFARDRAGTDEGAAAHHPSRRCRRRQRNDERYTDEGVDPVTVSNEARPAHEPVCASMSGPVAGEEPPAYTPKEEPSLGSSYSRKR